MYYDKLVKRLRRCQQFKCRECEYERVLGCSAMLNAEAADAIEELQQTVEHYKGCSDDWYKEACDYKSMLPHWIPVTEWLPKADEHDARGYAVPYLVMNGWMRVTARRTKDYWVLFGNGTVLEYVTHWMPLPEPPKGER